MEGSIPSPVPKSATNPNPMADLTEFDRVRLHDDMEQLNELVARKQALWEQSTDEAEKGELLAEIEQHQARIDQINTLLQ